MTDNNVHEASRDMTTSIQEANQAMVNSAVATQERNMQYAQITLENGIEVLKSYAEDTRHLIQELVEQQKPQQAVLQTTSRCWKLPGRQRDERLRPRNRAHERVQQ